MIITKRLTYILLLSLGSWLLALESTQAQEKLVYLEYCETLSFDESRLPGAQILTGSVRFRHEDALMFCDSAYFYEKENSFDAFGHVHFIQGDTLNGYGDVLYYDGNTRLARLRRNVRLVHTTTTLTTDSLNYDRNQNLAYYYTGGTIQDAENTLTSVWGQYNPPTHQAIFKTNVQLNNAKFTLTSEALHYNTETHIADLVTNTKIIYEEETTILSSKGWYNTETEKSMLLNRSQIIHTDGKQLTGDTIFYDKQLGFGQVLRRMEMTDTVQQMTLYGNYGEVWEHEKRGFATDSALIEEWGDSLHTFMHADTLWTEEIPYELVQLLPRDSLLVDSVMTWQVPDTIRVDTTFRQVRAFYGVRVYREDMQAVCDSLHYNGRDSIISLYNEPVAWSDNQQISADSIHIYLKNGEVDYAHGMGSAIAIQQETLTKYNQLSGKEMIAYVRDGELRQVDVNGNAETVFYPKEDDGSFMGVNKTQSSFVKIYLQDQQIEHILFTTATTGTMYPLDSIALEDTHLAGFFWAEHERPQVPGDVFDNPPRTPRPVQGAISASNLNEEAPQPTNDKKGRRNRQGTLRNKKM